MEICYTGRNVSILVGTQERLTNALQVMQFEKQVLWTVCGTCMSAMYHDVVVERKRRGFKAVGWYTLEKGKRNTIINNSWTSCSLLWVLHPVCTSVKGDSFAFQQLGLPVAKISSMDNVQAAADHVLSTYLKIPL